MDFSFVLVFLLALLHPTMPASTPRQLELVAALKQKAVAASAAATPTLVRILSSSKFRNALRDRGVDPSLYNAPASTILTRLRAEAEHSEIVHNLAIWTDNISEAADYGCPSCTGEIQEREKVRKSVCLRVRVRARARGWER